MSRLYLTNINLNIARNFQDQYHLHLKDVVVEILIWKFLVVLPQIHVHKEREIAKRMKTASKVLYAATTTASSSASSSIKKTTVVFYRLVLSNYQFSAKFKTLI